MVLSSLAEISSLPSGVKTMLRIKAIWPLVSSSKYGPSPALAAPAVKTKRRSATQQDMRQRLNLPCRFRACRGIGFANLRWKRSPLRAERELNGALRKGSGALP
jgi:hypothetical protein